MATEVRLPELGENITSGDVIKVLVSPGDQIAADQPLLELETDKATIEVPSSVGGTVQEVQVKAGEKVKVGQVILTVDENGAGATAPAARKPAAQARKEAPADRSATPEGEMAQHVAPGPQPADAEPREASRQQAREEREADRGEAPADARRGEVVDISRGARQAAPEPSERAAAPAAPSVRRLARELGVEIERVPGSGPGGRISPDDVKSYARFLIASAATGRAGAAAPPAALPDFEKWGAVERKRMTGVRRKTAEHLSYAWAAIPHVTQHDRADVTALEALRKKHEPMAEEAGGKLTVTAILLKIVAAALKRFPQFNSAIDVANEQLVERKYVHIGVAVDTDRGLLVPVIRDVDQKNILELAIDLQHYAERARARKLTLEEMEGGCFTITNLGGIGGTAFTPIVNAPEAAILGVSRSRMEPVYIDGQFAPRLMLPLSLSYDHRVIDGADAVRFLRWVVGALEQPFVLSLQG